MSMSGRPTRSWPGSSARPGITLLDGGGAAQPDGTLPMKIEMIEHLGSEAYLYVDPIMTPDSPVSIRGGRAVLRADKRQTYELGEVLHAAPRFGEAYFFDPDSEVNLVHL